MSFISTQALFVALGSTVSKATVYSAAYTWVLKDGIGQLGAILFSSRYGRTFDEDVKKWRFLAMIVLNASIIIEMFTLRFPGLFLLLASFANFGKNICFLLAAASRATINMQFAKQNNIGDIAGKSVAQFTASTLLGILIGLGFSNVFTISSPSTIIPLFTVLSLINVVSCYKSVNTVDEIYFNNQRAYGVMGRYLEDGSIITTKQFNAMEVFWLPSQLNKNIAKHIRYGKHSVVEVLHRFESTKEQRSSFDDVLTQL